MRINKIYLIVFTLFLTTFGMFSQEKIKKIEKPILPISIYTTLNKSTNYNRLFSIDNQLKFDTYKFVYLNEKSLKEGNFTIPFKNIISSPSVLIYESYMDVYNQLNIEKTFFKESDLYRPYIPPK